ncbi:lactate utilization protein C [bacterium BMS3Bbin01]|nr:lactate utilization protein C [bacterium BMS3Bbin01]
MKREAFLAGVRAALAGGQIPDAPATDPGPLLPDLPAVDKIVRFTESLKAIDGHVHVGDPLRILDEIVERYGPGPFLSWDSDRLPVSGVIERLERAGCSPVDAIVSASADVRRAHQMAYMDVHLGLTGAEAAFAESGSIVVRSGPGRPRMASAIPLIHIALLQTDRIFRSPMHWIMDSRADLASGANVIYITGPSRTADIEQQLTLGVHGPKELHVILI